MELKNRDLKSCKETSAHLRATPDCYVNVLVFSLEYKHYHFRSKSPESREVGSYISFFFPSSRLVTVWKSFFFF